MNKKARNLYAKLVILILCLCIVLRLFTLVLSKYESVSKSNANVDIALYLLKEDYKSMTLNLASLSPQNEAYVYSFSIGNEDGDTTAEVDMTYDLTLRTTTNLPLTYELYMNQEYNEDGAESIIINDEILPDDDGTYFRTMTTESIELKFSEPTTNLYQLVIYFPKNYNSTDYQDIIEGLEITVESKQVTS